MAKLRNTPADLFALLGAAGDHLGIPQEFVEKDYWVTELLRSIARPITDAIVIFKGGTSLSKAFDLIERFSEDVDILVSISPDAGFGKERVHNIFKGIGARAGDDLGIGPEYQFVESSETGSHRAVRYSYRALLPPRVVTDSVLLEMGRRGGDLPRERRSLRSMVARYAINSGSVGEDEYEEFAAFEMDVLSPERTLVEKLALLHRLSLEDSGSGLTRAGRHLYDVYKILNHQPTVAKLQEDPSFVGRLAVDADAHSERWGLPFEPRPPGGYGGSPSFDRDHPCAVRLRQGFQATNELIYGQVPTFEECVDAVRAAAALL